MLDSIFKEAKELLKEKENETTWFKIFTLFETLSKLIDSPDKTLCVLNNVSELLARSIQSDRSRLNGIALELLGKCADVAQKSYNFTAFLPIVIKLTGKSNKVFVSRAMDALQKICAQTDIKTVHKNVLDYIDNPNKNIRYAVFKMLELRISENPDMFKSFVEKGLKDASVEVRTICKSILIPSKQPQSAPVEVKKSAAISFTPRKNFKVDLECAQIKKLEDDVMKIAKEQVMKKPVNPTEHIQRKPINSDFFEKLNLLKKERKFITEEKKDDDLTPRKLDQYLNKYRSTTPQDSSVKIESLSRSMYEKHSANQAQVGALCQSTEISSNVMKPKENHLIQDDLPIASSNIMVETDDNVVVNQDITTDIKGNNNIQQCIDSLDVLSGKNDVNTNLDVITDKKNINTNLDIITDKNDVTTSIHLDVLPGKNDVNTNLDALTDKKVINTEYGQSTEEIKASFIYETIQFGKEMDSSGCRNQSVIHELVLDNLPSEVPGSDKKIDYSDILHEYENSLILDDQNNSESFVEAADISELSRSFANIFIDQSKQSFIAQNEVSLESQDELSGYDNINEDIIGQYADQQNDFDNQCIPDTENKSDDLQHNNVLDEIDLIDVHVVESESPVQNINENDIIDAYDGIIEESMENKRVDLDNGLQLDANIVTDNDRNMDSNLSLIQENDLEFENLCVDFNIFQSIGNFNDNLASFIEKAAKNDHISKKDTQDATFCVRDSNETIIIESLHNRDPSNVFNQESMSKTSCVGLFNEAIFSSEEENSFLAKTSGMKEKPSFDFKAFQFSNENGNNSRRRSI